MSVVKLKPSATVVSLAEAKLAELHKQRREFVAGMADLQGKITKIGTAPKEIDQVRTELASLTAKEQAAAARWADAGAEGPPPAVDMEARAEMAKRLAAADAQAAAGEAAVSVLNARYNELARQINALNIPIATAATEILFERLDAQVAELRALVEKLVPLVGSIDSLRGVIVNEAHRIKNKAEGQGTVEFFRRLERVPATGTILNTMPPDCSADLVRELEALKRGDQ